MSHWEAAGKSDDWYTPKYIFDALGCRFDLDVASPNNDGTGTHVPAAWFYAANGLEQPWRGFVWMNPPFGKRNAITPWLAKFFKHGHGIALAPDRTSAPWFQEYAPKADAILFVSPKVKFERPDGTTGDSPGSGTVLMASGNHALRALHAASRLGMIATCFRKAATARTVGSAPHPNAGGSMNTSSRSAKTPPQIVQAPVR